MAVGFACAVGLDDMIFNDDHHNEVTEAHVHVNGLKHHHEEKDPADKEKGGCCSDKVVKLALVDKSVPQTNSIVHPLFFTAFISSYYNIDILYHSQITPSTRYFVRGNHPPIPNIRIAIQSFQI